MEENIRKGNMLCKEVLQLGENPIAFENLAFQIFEFQFQHNPVYQKFILLCGKSPSTINHMEDIPFMPISFFKSQEIKTGIWQEETHFKTSGTSKSGHGIHPVFSLSFYHQLSILLFEKQFGALEQFQILALLPHYLENPNSSLISMVRAFGKKAGEEAIFLGLNFEGFESRLNDLRKGKKRILVFSVSYALLRLAESFPIDLSDCLVVETGGMKGFGKEVSKKELIQKITDSLKIKDLISEFGMTEMLSQAYARPLEFSPGFSHRSWVRSFHDPFEVKSSGRGLANWMDLGNVFSCAFLATDDVIDQNKDGTFQILGRAKDAELRGCNLLFADG